MATWIRRNPIGVINLDHVVQAIAQTDGTVHLYLDAQNYVAVSMGSDQQSALAVLQKLTQAYDPADLA